MPQGDPAANGTVSGFPVDTHDAACILHIYLWTQEREALFMNIIREPDQVVVQTDDGYGPARAAAGGGAWEFDDIEVRVVPREPGVAVSLRAPQTPVKRVRLHWDVALPAGARFLGDHWERAYGDLEWRGLVPERVMPWYFLVWDGCRAHGYGVKTGPAALCYWQADTDGVHLWLDVRCGGDGVMLGDRVLRVADVIFREGTEGETPFAAAGALCRALCDEPRLPEQPVYGANNWYYAYGNSSHEQILADARLAVDVAPGGSNRPFMVVDAGWQDFGAHPDRAVWSEGWDAGNARFPDMPGLAAAIREAGARPGIWIRPLIALAGHADTLMLSRPEPRPQDRFLDPTIPEVLAYVAASFRRLREWGFEMIKHDFSTWDMFGRWGADMAERITCDGWHFQDRSLTSAEIVLDLYGAMREGAGDALIIGCNTIGHLGAGLFEIQRTGDDTSGQEWGRTRKMGVNTLAFRMPQHNTFFAADADCVGLTPKVPWALNRQWLSLLAKSGTVLLVSVDPEAVGAAQRAALKEAFALAATPQPAGEPLDWEETTCPRRWRLSGETVEFDWCDHSGPAPISW